MKCSWASDDGMMRGARRNGGEHQSDDNVRMIDDNDVEVMMVTQVTRWQVRGVR